MMRFSGVVSAGAMFALLGAAVPASAATIDGTFSVAGSVTYDNLLPITLNPGDSGLDFQATMPPPTAPTGGVIEIAAVTPGSYLATYGLTIGTTALIKNITNVTPVTDTDYAYVPVDTVGSPLLADFLAGFSVGLPNDLHFDITSFPSLTGTTCGGAVMSCVEGPFQLTQITDAQGNPGVQIAWKMLGILYANGDADFAPYTATFTLTIDALTLAEVGDRLLNSGKDIGCGASSDFLLSCGFIANFNPTPTVPEPTTLLTFGAGVLGLAAVARRRRKKA